MMVLCAPDNPGSSPQVETLKVITPAESFLLCEGIYSQVLEIRTWTSLGDRYSVYHTTFITLNNVFKYLYLIPSILATALATTHFVCSTNTCSGSWVYSPEQNKQNPNSQGIYVLVKNT